MTMKEIEELQALIDDRGLDAFELSILHWLHVKCRIFRGHKQELDRSEWQKYADLKVRFVEYGVCKLLPALDSPTFGLSADDVMKR